jgi:hypothetical protein
MPRQTAFFEKPGFSGFFAVTRSHVAEILVVCGHVSSKNDADLGCRVTDFFC